MMIIPDQLAYIIFKLPGPCPG